MKTPAIALTHLHQDGLRSVIPSMLILNTPHPFALNLSKGRDMGMRILWARAENPFTLGQYFSERNRRTWQEKIPAISRLIVTVLLSVYVLFYHTQSYALSWTINRNVQAQEIYSDNIALARSGSQRGAFVESITPGVAITGQSAISSMSLNYQMQNLYNAGGNNGLSIYNQLSSNSRNTFIPNTLFLNSSSSISQQYINNSQLGASNINGSSNSTNVYNFGLSPSWTPHFSNYANGSFLVNANTTAVGANANSSNNTSTLAPLSNTFNLAETMSLSSGAYFQRVNWGMSFNNNESFVANSQNISYQNLSARVSVPINAYFNVFTQGGHSSNSYQSTTGATNSGTYYTAGGQWTPSQRFNLTVGAGNNSYVTVFFSPMPRLTSTTTYSNNAVGTSFGQSSGATAGVTTGATTGTTAGIGGSGNSGQNWQTAMNYQAPRSTWTLTHTNTTTTAQQILAQNQLVNPLTNTGPNQYNIGGPILTNSVIVTTAWNLSVSFTTGKSTFNVNAYDRNYSYQSGIGNNQQTIGVTGTWNWPFASKTSAFLTPTWQTTKNPGSTNSQYYSVALGMNRTITPQLNGTLQLQHINQTSEVSNVNNLLPTTGYQENRATATLSMRF